MTPWPSRSRSRCLAGLFALLVHSFADFNLHIPANALLATLLAAIGMVAAHLPRGRGQEGLCLPFFTLRLSRPLRLLAYPLVIALTLLLAREIVRPWVAGRFLEQGQLRLAEQDFQGAEEAFPEGDWLGARERGAPSGPGRALSGAGGSRAR